uniref:Uncharacterized protein n=1 Tax=Siphoviridae sp. ct3R43 TaxID=2825321 RepID=A0A8S5VFR0_9CAUD|nr:MAG TPA: hypothetical protein [Siphoviridae sp. ct3R43]
MPRLRDGRQSPDGRLTRRHTHGRVISGNPTTTTQSAKSARYLRVFTQPVGSGALFDFQTSSPGRR